MIFRGAGAVFFLLIRARGIDVSEKRNCGSKDEVRWNKGGKMRFDKNMDECGNGKCWGAEQCTTDCIQGREKYTNACSTCFGKLAACGRSNCWWTCFWKGSDAESCTKCAETYCIKDFKQCSHFTPPPKGGGKKKKEEEKGEAEDLGEGIVVVGNTTSASLPGACASRYIFWSLHLFDI